MMMVLVAVMTVMVTVMVIMMMMIKMMMMTGNDQSLQRLFTVHFLLDAGVL